MGDGVRDRQDGTRQDLGRRPPPTPTARGPQVCRTAALPGSAYPTHPNRFYGVVPLREDGPEVEGGVATFEDRGAAFLALHVGSTAPPSGSRVIVFDVARVGPCFEY